jgi:catechol 2,3-dioxygenase-like lactoylglutathione lyase family enzyme
MGGTLRHLALRVRDPEASKKFYTDGLGLTFVGYRPSGQAFDLSDGYINLTVIPYEGPERPAFEEVTEYVHFGFRVADALECYQRLQAMGAQMLRLDVKERLDPEAPTPRGSFKVADPDGNVVDVTGNVEEWRI